MKEYFFFLIFRKIILLCNLLGFNYMCITNLYNFCKQLFNYFIQLINSLSDSLSKS